MKRWLQNRRVVAVGVLSLISVLLIVGAGVIFWMLRDGAPAGDGNGTAGGTTTGPDIRVETGGSGGPVGAAPFTAPEGEGQLTFRLSAGQAATGTVEALPLVGGTPLAPEDVQAVLDRLPALTPDPGDETDFSLPPTSLPPPRPGETVDEPFPPPAPPDVTPEPPAGEPLEVVRFAPEGEIPVAPFLNVTFNQPMVPLATDAQLSAAEVPVELTPELPGEWRWLGTQTLSFVYEGDTDRFPMATEYEARVPAGTTSANGNVLAEAVTWQFRTPPPQLERATPQNGPRRRDVLFFASFDQQIDPAAVLETIRVTADGAPVSIRLATDAEVEADATVSRLAEQAVAGRWLAFRAPEPLPADAAIEVTIGPGTPSAEGPLTTEEAQSFSFRTYAPLQITDTRCRWGDECPPLAPFYVEFNNPLDVGAFTADMIAIEPALPGAVVRPQGSTLEIRGATEGRTRYEVTVSGAIPDRFGQTLGEDETVTFRVGDAAPFLTGPEQPLVTLDPAADTPTFTVYAVNYDRLEVTAYAVTPEEWPAYQEWLQTYYRDEDGPPTPPGREVLDESIAVEGAADTLTEVPIDLSAALDGEFGHLIVVVQPPGRLFENWRRRPVVRAWVQATEIGLDAFADPTDLVAWATALEDGRPLDGVSLRLFPDGATTTTGGDGVATLSLSPAGGGMLIGQRGDDTAILPANPHYWSDDDWGARPRNDALRWYVMDDRNLYRPGEDVHVKGWLRRIGAGPQGDVSADLGGISTVRYVVVGPQGNELTDGQAELTGLGGFDFAFTLPDNANLGYANIRFTAEGGTDLAERNYHHAFQIQEFRRPEFEVTARAETPGPYLVGDHATVATSAAYFAGGPLPNADVTWRVSARPGSYAPPNWPDFIFGTWTPWWIGPVYERGIAVEREFYDPFGPEPVYEEVFEGNTDAAGEHYLRIDFEALDTPQPFSLRAQATVMDVNRQAWSAATNLLVHPADLYVGVRSERTFVRQGEPLEIAAIVTDLDGNPVPGREITIKAGVRDWRYRDGAWREETANEQTCTVTSADEPVTCTFDTAAGGTYQITATVADDRGRTNQSQFQRWVTGGQRPPSRDVEQETVSLIPGREEYAPGDTAEILVQAPFSPAEGLLTVSRSGILYTERFRVEDGSHTLQIPIAEAHIPNLHVQVDLVGAAPRTGDDGQPLDGAPPRPAYATGNLNLSVSRASRALMVDVAPAVSELEPGGETTIDVTVADANGVPVPGAELAVVVVDEAILALSGYDPADPLSVFYTQRPPDVRSSYGRATVVLARPESLLDADLGGNAERQVPVTRIIADGAVVEEAEMAMEAPAAQATPTAAAGDDAAGAEPDPIRVRTDFNPLAAFVPAVQTGSDGRASVPVALPDNLTRYRVLVVAVAGGTQFGQGEANLTGRLPLMVRPSAPRFLNFGDRFQLPVVVQNQTDEAMTVDVVVQASNVTLTDGPGLRVTVPANDRVEVRFPAETANVGTARFQIGAVSGPYADAAAIELPVYTPATTEAFATYGVLDEGSVSQPLAAPTGVFTQFGGLEIQTSSTALQALTDAVIYLVDYPYGCSEQIASRVLGIAALRDVLAAFEAEGLPDPAGLETAVQADIERLIQLQNPDGGWPIWRRGKPSQPFYSIHAAHALQRAQAKGFTVAPAALGQAHAHLQEIEATYPSWYSQRTKWTLSAYALHVRRLMGDSDPAKAARLLDEAGLDGLSLEGLAWLWPVLADDAAYTEQVEDIGRHFDNRASETAGAANFTTSYGDEAYLLLASDRRTDAVILDALMAVRPESDLIPKVVNGLLAHRSKGRWSNTQENVFVLLALDRYFQTFEAQTPDFVARIWLGDTYAGSHTYEGRTTERHATEIPMNVVATGGEQPLVLSKDGPGRLYYRLGLSYAPTDLTLAPLDRGFVVERTYEAVDDPDDVWQDEDGVWHVKAGARVRVRLTMVARDRRYHVALVDPLPAGLEIVNPALAASEDVPADPAGRRSWWWWTWYEHQNMRDHRAEAFTSLLWEGVYTYSYVTRATTPGTFVAPPAKAEEMYAPEVFGRSASELVIIE